jgi:hypothetical protein
MDRNPRLNLFDFAPFREMTKPKHKFLEPMRHLLEMWKSVPEELKREWANISGRRITTTNPGLHIAEKMKRDACWSQWLIAVSEKISAGKTYDEATKAVAKDEGISLKSLRKIIPKMFSLAPPERRPWPPRPRRR